MSLLKGAGADGRVARDPHVPLHDDTTLCNVPCTVASHGIHRPKTASSSSAPGAPTPPALWRAILALGKDQGVKPIGLGARDTLRLECKLALYGNDIDETTNPLEAGLGWVVKLDGDDFIGRDALHRQQAEGVTRKLVGIEMTDRGIARHGYPVVDRSGRKSGRPGHQRARPRITHRHQHRPRLRPCRPLDGRHGDHRPRPGPRPHRQRRRRQDPFLQAREVTSRHSACVFAAHLR
jgi:hypothetical protein